MWTEEKIQLERKEIMKRKIKVFQQLVSNYGSEKTIEFFKTFIDSENLMNLAISKIEPFRE
jgi:tRNA A37 threonylcarbamoyladenosine dehydratase